MIVQLVWRDGQLQWHLAAVNDFSFPTANRHEYLPAQDWLTFSVNCQANTEELVGMKFNFIPVKVHLPLSHLREEGLLKDDRDLIDHLIRNTRGTQGHSTWIFSHVNSGQGEREVEINGLMSLRLFIVKFI